jgi:hypothetical protein
MDSVKRGRAGSRHSRGGWSRRRRILTATADPRSVLWTPNIHQAESSGMFGRRKNPFFFNPTMAAAKVNNFHLVNSQADYVRIVNLSFYS